MSNDNPYAPPQAPVETPSVASESLTRPPTIVLISVGCLALFAAVFGTSQVVYAFRVFNTGEISGVYLLTPLVVLALRVWFLFKVWRGRNWARIALLVLVLLGLGTSVLGWVQIMKFTADRMGGGLSPWAYWGMARPLIETVAVALLFTSPAARWFRRLQ